MHITKYLYRAKFERPDLINGPIISFLCYAETPEKAEITARAIGMTKAQGMNYLGVDHLPFGFVLSSRSARVPATIMVELDSTKE